MKTMEAAELWLNGSNFSVQSRQEREWFIKRFAEKNPEWPDKPHVIMSWINEQHVSRNTARAYQLIFSSMGNYLKINFDLPNPCEKMQKIKRQKNIRRYLKPDEIMLLLSACRYGYDRELILTLVGSTCRIGELAFDPRDPKHNPGIKGKDVYDGYIIVKGKTGEKKYILDKRVCNALKQLAGSPENHCFYERTGEPAKVQALKDRVRAVFARAGITGKFTGAHTLRHSSASLVAKITGDVMAVKGLLQHEDINTSMIYIHDAEAEAAEKINVLEMISQNTSKPNGEKPYQVKMLESSSGHEMTTALVEYGKDIETDGEKIETQSTLEQEAFPEIEPGIKIRPQLTTEDLELLRRLMIVCFNTEIGRADALAGRSLMRRMLRKTGGE